MINRYNALKVQVEDTVHQAYARLADYAQSDRANPKAVYAQRKVYDTFAEGWNEAEAEIERLRREIKELKKRSVTNQNGDTADQKYYQISDLKSPFSRHDPQDKEYLRATWNAHQMEKWSDHF